MRSHLKSDVKRGRPLAVVNPRLLALVAAPAETNRLVARHLRQHEIEVSSVECHGAMAAALFDAPAKGGAIRPILFVLDLRIACGESAINALLADYDDVLNTYVLAGNAWPKTLCLVDTEQTYPIWLQAHPHFRATLLADEVETVVGCPRHPDWNASFETTLSRCLSN